MVLSCMQNLKRHEAHLEDIVPVEHGIGIRCMLPSVDRIAHHKPVARLQKIFLFEGPPLGWSWAVGAPPTVPPVATAVAMAG